MRANRRDLVEAEIVAALGKVGAQVELIAHRSYDAVVGFRGRNYCLEFKSPRGTLTGNQRYFRDTWPGQYAVVRNADEALRVIGALR